MSTVIALLVGVGFLWSTVLFFSAIVTRERHQEAGFGWALAGAVLYFVVFPDRLPGSPSLLRGLVNVLPWTGQNADDFTSSFLALVLLLVVYLFRVAVFYRLFAEDDVSAEDAASEEIINDYVAPTLSYLCFAICLVSLLQPAYGLSVVETALLSIFLIIAYYWGLMPRLMRYLQDLGTLMVIFFARFRRLTSRGIVMAIGLIAQAERLRRPDHRGAVSEWARHQLEAQAERREVALAREKQILKEIADRLSGRAADAGRVEK
ncbi:MAG TPA: hypothetical protein VJ204_01290 [Solirubrobacterales bacterium]|nr:hypothetical protein [Solirubrobacterales bacterium]